MKFRSDNTAAAAPEILAALIAANEGVAPAYGNDAWTARLDAAFSAVFERDVRVFTVASGTAANAIALAYITPPWGAVLCHREAHIERDEGGAPEFYAGGAKLTLLDGSAAKLTPDALREGLGRNPRNTHAPLPSAVSISQATERGAAYSPAEIAALSAVCKQTGLKLHMDGARFANALVAANAKAADLTWRAGIDVLSFGATKNGALSAEAIVLFDPAHADEVQRRRKRGGHLLCKGRYAAAQLLAYLEDGLWLKLARRSNELAQRIGEAAGSLLMLPVETNQIFIKTEPEQLARLRSAGVDFYDWGAEGSNEARFVVAWNQTETDVAALCALLQSLR